MRKVLNFINGEYCEGVKGEWMESINPATEEKLADVVNSTSEDVALAIEAAKKAYPSWSAKSPERRAKVLRKMADIIKSRLDELATIESMDNGKPLSVAKTVDIPRAAVNLQFFADAICQYSQDAYHMQGAVNYTRRQPLGIVTCISPWNLPLYLFTWKIAPALAAGNCVIGKPSEVTPITASILGEIAKEAGLPNGVLNILHGHGSRMGEELVQNKEIKAVSFTGSTATGKVISKLAASEFKKVSLEMGGKNATIVFKDCDYDKALSGVLRAAYSNQGQICLCGSRILIHESLYERMKGDLIEKIGDLKVGNPMSAGTQQGALVSKEHFEKVMSCIELAKSEGGIILTGGKRHGNSGYFIEPTLIEGLGASCQTNQQEIFGPVATIQSFKTEEEAIEIANSTNYGLAFSVWTENSSRTHRVAEKLDAGIVWINTWMLRDLRTPFGGVKDSGVGREGGYDALRFFTEAKNICIQY
ncbi:MAG: aldehyde dehydrogenase [Bacteriovoracaceae bacterium]|nr:aldehyde dehydrogenase [Bacteriovoracaceae bacterium]